MTKDEIAQAMQDSAGNSWGNEAHFQRFAALVRAAEREACAKVCESMRPSERDFDQRFYIACTLNANAIRARGEK